jgi:stringent starvation protein B
MLSKRPYLVPAFYDWIVDQGHVPHLVVDADADGVTVPADFVEDGHIQLNVGPSAVRDFHMDRAGISFEARFAGKPERIFVPMHAVRAVIDRDTGQGATFPDEPDEEFPQAAETAVASPKSSRKGAPRLRAVRGGSASSRDDVGDRSGKGKPDESDDDGPPDDDPPPSGGGGSGGPSLRVVK